MHGDDLLQRAPFPTWTPTNSPVPTSDQTDGDIPHDPNTRTQLFTGNTVRNQDCFTETGNHKSMGKKLVSLIVMKFRDKLEYDNISIVKW